MTRVTLQEASRAAVAAAEAGDLDALQRALEAREAAIAAGDIPSPADLKDGEQVFTMLQAVIREVSIELARLGQISAGFAYGARVGDSRVEVRG